jgi:hypothetical protein
LAAAAAAPGRTEVAFEATVQPDEISFGDTRELRYRLRMTTVGGKERFRVRVKQPHWDPLSAHAPAGFAVVPDCSRRHLVLKGPGRLADTVCAPRPAGEPRCQRGSSRWEVSGEVALPAHSSSTLVARVLTGAPPPHAAGW